MGKKMSNFKNADLNYPRNDTNFFSVFSYNLCKNGVGAPCGLNEIHKTIGGSCLVVDVFPVEFVWFVGLKTTEAFSYGLYFICDCIEICLLNLTSWNRLFFIVPMVTMSCTKYLGVFLL
jgi:hypothetical protein